MSKVRTVFGRSLSVGSNSGDNRSYSYDNPAFLRGFHGSRGKTGHPDLKMSDPAADIEDPDGGPDETDIDDDSFRSDLERDSAHSSLVHQIHSRQQQQQQQQQHHHQQQLQLQQQQHHGGPPLQYQQQQQQPQQQLMSISQQQQQVRWTTTAISMGSCCGSEVTVFTYTLRGGGFNSRSFFLQLPTPLLYLQKIIDCRQNLCAKSRLIWTHFVAKCFRLNILYLSTLFRYF